LATIETTTKIGSSPTLRLIWFEGLPLVVVAPFTVTVALELTTVGVRVMLEMLYGTLSEYERVLVEKAGDSEPTDETRLERVSPVLVPRWRAIV
jgi:hypothetical protein